MPDESVAEQLIAVIRQQSGLSQAELARRTGLTRSVLSAYARGRRQPGVDALARIAAAAGLEIGVGPPDGVRDMHAQGDVPGGRAAGASYKADPAGVAGGQVTGSGGQLAGARQRRAAERMARTRAAWARGAVEGKQLDRLRARRLTPEQRIEEGLALARIAERLQAGRSVR
jgi:transcriptional regulator with XRE-family HTH domain